MGKSKGFDGDTIQNLDGSYTSYGSDGSRLHTSRNFEGGYTTFDQNGNRSVSNPDSSGGFDTVHSDGSRSRTYSNGRGGFETVHPDGDRTTTIPNLSGTGYTSYRTRASTVKGSGDFGVIVMALIVAGMLIVPMFSAIRYMIPAIVMLVSGAVVKLVFNRLIRESMYGVSIYLRTGLWMSALLCAVYGMIEASEVQAIPDYGSWVMFGPAVFGVMALLPLILEEGEDYPGHFFLVFLIAGGTVVGAYYFLTGKKFNSEPIQYLYWIRWAPVALCSVFAVLEFFVVLVRKK